MPISYFPLTINVSQIVGTAVRRARLQIATNLPEGTPLAYGDELALPGGIYTLPGGVGEVDLPTRTGITNLVGDTLQYIVTGEYSVDGAVKLLKPIYIDAPTSTAPANLASFVGVTSVPPTFMGAAVAQLQAKVDEAEAIKAYVTDVSNIDTTVSAVDFALGQPGPAATLNAAIAAPVATRVAVNEAPLSPLRYGAVFNGTTNDTAAVQAAIDAAEVARGEVLLPGGTFRASGLNLRSGVKLRGMGKGKTRMLHQTNTYGIRAQGTSGTPFVGCEVSDLTIVGTNGTPSQMGLQFEYVNNGLIARCDIGYMGNNSINYHYSRGGRIEANDVHDNTNFGILFFNANRLSVVNNNVYDLAAAGQMHFGIQSKASQLCQITGNRVRNIAGHGLYAYSDGTMDDFGHIFSGNIVTQLVSGGSAAGMGIYLNTTSGVKVVGNHIEDTDSGGISMSAASRCTIEGNTILRGAGAAAGIGANATTTLAAILGNTIDECGQGVLLTGSTKSRVAGNTITRGMSSASGLYALIGLRAAASNNVVENNTALEGVSRGLYEEGTASNNVIRNNTVGQTTGTAYAAAGTGGIRTGNVTVAVGGALTAVA